MTEFEGRTFEVDFGAEPYEPGALLISILVHPGAGNTSQFERVRLSLCSAALQGRAQVDREWSRSSQRIIPNYALRSVEQNKLALRPYVPILNDRLVAAAMAFDMIEEFKSAGELQIAKLRSVAKLADHYAPQAREKDPSNFTKRIWRPSRPVIHLAVAVRLLLNGWREKDKEIFVDDLVLIPQHVEWIIEEASRVQAFILSDKRFGVTLGNLITLRERN